MRVSSAASLIRQTLERFAGNAENRPFVHWHGAELLVELDRRFIPIEHRPFESPAVGLARDPRQLDEHGAPKSSAAHFRDDEQVFEIQTRFAEECGEIVEEDSERGRLVLGIAKQDFCSRPRAEETLPHALFRHDSLVRQTLVLGQLPDEPDNDVCVGFFCFSDLELRPVKRKKPQKHQKAQRFLCVLVPLVTSTFRPLRESPLSKSPSALSRKRDSTSLCTLRCAREPHRNKVFAG